LLLAQWAMVITEINQAPAQFIKILFKEATIPQTLLFLQQMT